MPPGVARQAPPVIFSPDIGAAINATRPNGGVGSIIPIPRPNPLRSSVGPAANGNAGPPIQMPAKPGTGALAAPGSPGAPQGGAPRAAAPSIKPPSRIGGMLSDIAGGMGSYQANVDPMTAFAQGFAGSVQARVERRRAEAAAAIAAEDRAFERQYKLDERDYNRGRDVTEDRRNARRDDLAERREARESASAEVRDFAAATNAAAAWYRAKHGSTGANSNGGLSYGEALRVQEQIYKVYGLDKAPDYGTLTDDEITRRRELMFRADQDVKAQLERLDAQRRGKGGGGAGAPARNLDDAAADEGQIPQEVPIGDLPPLSGNGTEDEPFDGITDERQLDAIPSGQWFLYGGELYQKN